MGNDRWSTALNVVALFDAQYAGHRVAPERRRSRGQGVSSICSLLRAALACVGMIFTGLCYAGDSGSAAGNAEDGEEEVVVSGEQPGPGLWKVTNGTHVLWVLGTLSPAPRDMTWRSKQVEAVIAQSKEVIERTSIDTNIGFFTRVRLLPAVYRARKNPDGASLKQILTPELYARWTAQKLRYLGNDRGIEEWRPMFAGFQLFSKALKKSGLTDSTPVVPAVRKLAKKHNVPLRTLSVKVELDNPKQLIRDFTETPRALDIACLEATIERLETDMEPMKQRAKAWAVGDVDELKRIGFPRQRTACQDALMSAPALQDEFNDVKNRVINEWVTAAERALAKNDVSLAVLPVEEIFAPDGRLAKLAEKGYAVEWPQS
jgi:uncharacterized protein YbaP (TraB family)